LDALKSIVVLVDILLCAAAYSRRVPAVGVSATTVIAQLAVRAGKPRVSTSVKIFSRLCDNKLTKCARYISELSNRNTVRAQSNDDIMTGADLKHIYGGVEGAFFLTSLD